MQHMHQPITKWYDPLHIITWLYWFIDLDLTCSSPLPRSIGAKSCPSFIVTCSSSLQSLRFALHACNWSIKPSLISIFSTLITCASFATSSSHFYLHDICCSHTCTYGLITCVSHINTISPPKTVTQLTKPNKDFSAGHSGCDNALSISILEL
jgi:hypothetical protein